MAPHRLTIRSLGDLIAAIPSSLGFRPTNAVVVMTATGENPPMLALALHAAMPPAHHIDLLADHDLKVLTGQLLAPIRSVNAHTAYVFVIDDTTTAPTATHRAITSSVRDALLGIEVTVAHTVWTPSTTNAAQWNCMDDDGCTGTVPEDTAITFTAAAALDGNVIFASRAELQNLLVPDQDDVLHRRQALLDGIPRTGGTVVHDLAIIDAVITDGIMPTTDEQIVTLGMALADTAVRDACLDYVFSPQARVAEELWLTLARVLPASHRATPATLLAITAHVRGDGALANIAVDVALRAQPGHPLATLVQLALKIGIHPQQLRDLLRNTDLPARPATVGGSGT